MKHCFFLFVVFTAALLTACNPYPRKSVRMNDALEQAKAVYGDGNLEIEVDTVLFIPGLSEAPDYFAGKRQYGKAALAALLNGYTEKDFDKEAAMLSFKEAEHYGELAQDSLTMARAEYWIGKMLYEEGNIKETLPLLKASFDLIGNRKIDRSIVENGMAAAYILLHQLDSAEMFLQNSLHDAQISGSEITERKALQNLALLCWLQGDNNEALASLRRVLEHETVEKETSVKVFLTFGNTFMTMNEPDSAALYYRRMEEIMSVGRLKSVTKVSAYDALLNFAKKQGNDSLALQYYEKHESALFEVMNQRQKQTNYRIQKQYDYAALRNEMSQKMAQNQRIVALAVVLLLCVLVWVLFRSAQASKREARANANLFHFMQQNKALVESNMAQEEKTVHVEQQLSDRLFARLYAMQKLDYCLKNPVDKIALKDLEREVFGTGDHWNAVKEVLVNLYPGLWESLKLKYPEMDEMELRVCMLSRLKLSRLGEAALLGISTSVLDKLRTKVRKVMEQDNNP